MSKEKFVFLLLRTVLVMVVAIPSLNAQTEVDLRTQSKSVDFSAASTTKPIKTGTVLPAACGLGEAFFQTNAPPGANLYLCTSQNSWALQSGVAIVGTPGTPVQFTIATGGGACPGSCQTILATTTNQGIHPTVTVYDSTGAQINVGITCAGGTYGCADSASSGVITIGPFAKAGTYTALIQGATGGFTNPLTTQADTIYSNGGGASRFPDGTLGFHPDYYPNGCTVASVYHPQPADCAFALASASVAQNHGASVVFGPNTYLKNDAWVLPFGTSGPSPTNFPYPTVSLIGSMDAFGTGTTLLQNVSIATDMVSTPTGAYPYISPVIRDITFFANQNAPGCLTLTGIARSRLSNLYCNGFNGTGHGIQIGGGIGSNGSYEVYGDHLAVEGADAVESLGSYAYGTIGVSGGFLNAPTFTSNGANYGGSPGMFPVVLLFGYGEGDRPCVTMPTNLTATITAGSVSAISWTGGSTCNGPVYFRVGELPPARFGFDIETTDSLYSDLVVQTAGQVAGLYTAGSNRFLSPHVYYVPVGIKDAGKNTFLGPELDSTWVYAWALGGPLFWGPYTADSYSNTQGTQIYAPTYNWNASFPGASKFWMYNGGQNSTLDGGQCGSTATWPDYHEFVTSGGPVDTGNGVLPSSFDVRVDMACGGTFPSLDRHAFGGIVNGSWTLQALAPPAAPTVTPAVVGSTTYSYEVVAKMLDGSHSAASPAGTTTIGNATLSSVNFNTISWAAVASAACYDIYKSNGAGMQGLIGYCVNGTSYTDTTGAGNGAIAPTSNTTAEICQAGFCWSLSPSLGTYQLTSSGSEVFALTSNGGAFNGLSGALGSNPSASVTGTGCSVGTPSGNNLSGTISVTGAGTCTLTLTWSNGLTYPSGSSCSVLQDIINSRTAVETTDTTTTASFAPLIVSASDTLRYGPCVGR